MPGPKPLVLIVDPDPDARAIMELLVRHSGYRVACTAAPAEALRMATRLGCSVIIGEHPLLLPDGGTLCSALLMDERTSHIPFIAVTAGAMPDQLEDARRAHPHGVFEKPVLPRRVRDHVHTLAGQRRASGAR